MWTSAKELALKDVSFTEHRIPRSFYYKYL